VIFFLRFENLPEKFWKVPAQGLLLECNRKSPAEKRGKFA
jgi:hypothetical protein